MTGNTTLMDIQSTVFENIPGLLEELEQAQFAKSFSAQIVSEKAESELNAMQFRNREKKGSDRFKSSRFVSSSKTLHSNKRPDKFNKSATKFCRICHLAGSDPQTYNSHEIGRCSRLTVRDMESLRDALVLNGMVTISSDEPEQPEYYL